jgi:hypothetical protein
MSAIPSSPLAEFHQFVGSQLLLEEGPLITPEAVLARWREQQETLAAIREGLADIEAGRTVSLEDFDSEFRQRHGIEGAA